MGLECDFADNECCVGLLLFYVSILSVLDENRGESLHSFLVFHQFLS